MDQTTSTRFLEDRARYIRIFHKEFRFSAEQLALHYDMSLLAVKDILTPKGTPLDREGVHLRMGTIYSKWVKGATIVSLAFQYNCSRYVLIRALQHHANKIKPGLYRQISERNRNEREAQSRKRRAAARGQAEE